MVHGHARRIVTWETHSPNPSRGHPIYEMGISWVPIYTDFTWDNRRLRSCPLLSVTLLPTWYTVCIEYYVRVLCSVSLYYLHDILLYRRLRSCPLLSVTLLPWDNRRLRSCPLLSVTLLPWDNRRLRSCPLCYLITYMIYCLHRRLRSCPLLSVTLLPWYNWRLHSAQCHLIILRQ